MVRIVLLAILLSGCDKLFPELSGGPMMPAGGPDGGPPSFHISGTVCVLTDARDYRSCTLGRAGNFRVTVEETREQTQTDASGAFLLPLSRALDVATLAAVDPTGTYAPSIVQVRLKDGVLERMALPIVAHQSLVVMAQQNGFSLDPSRGAVLAWATDAMGTPVAGVRGAARAQGQGPYYDGLGPSELAPGSGTRQYGLIAAFDLRPASITLDLTPPAPYLADAYELPVRPNALTLSVLPLASR